MIINLTQNKILSNNERVATSFLSKGRGLMLRRKQNLVMVFKKPTRISLHNFLVFFTHDVLLLNEKKQIIALKRNFKPFTLYDPKVKASYVIELALPKNKAYNLGDQIEIKY